MSLPSTSSCCVVSDSELSCSVVSASLDLQCMYYWCMLSDSVLSMVVFRVISICSDTLVGASSVGLVVDCWSIVYTQFAVLYRVRL